MQKFDQRVRDAIAVVPEGQWREFAGFSGPRLDATVGWDKVVLIGDANHPLSGRQSRPKFFFFFKSNTFVLMRWLGAFGSGATFAMEDAWILARTLEHTQRSPSPIRDALAVFDAIRSPYYAKM